MQACDDLGPELAAYVSGNLAPEDSAQVEAHLAGCDRCLAVERSLREVWSQMAVLPEEEVPDVLLRGIKASLAEERGPSSPWHVAIETLLALALMTVLGVVCPIPIVCHFFAGVIKPLFGQYVAVFAHTLTAAMMGMMPLLVADLTVSSLARSWEPSRRRAAATLFGALVALGVPALHILPPDPLTFASWGTGTALAAWFAVRLMTRLQPVLAA